MLQDSAPLRFSGPGGEAAWQARLDAAEPLVSTDPDQALVLILDALELARHLGNPRGTARALTLQGGALLAQGKTRDAQDVFTQGRDAALDVGDGVTEARALNGLGLVARAHGQYGEAMERHLASLHVAQAHGDDAGQARTLGNIGQVQSDLGDHELALHTYREMQQLATRAGHVPLQSAGIVNVVFALHELGRYEEVLETARAHLPFIRAHRMHQHEVVLQVNAMASLVATGRAAEAVQTGEQVRSLADQYATREQATHFRITCGHALLERGQLDAAQVLLDRALADARQAGCAPQERLALGHLSTLLARREAWPQAFALLQAAQALDGTRRVQDLDRQARVLSVQLHTEMLAREAAAERARTSELARLADELAAAQQHLAEQARHDLLTGLPGRAQFQAELDRRLAVAADEPFGVLFIDLDRFKAVNDALGHDVGDRLLQQVARRLRRAVRSSDLVARMGGDEFTVILRGVQRVVDAERTAQKILDGFALPFDVNGRSLHVTASVGVALAPQDGQDVATLHKRADIAMSRAKQGGRNGVRSFQPEMEQESAERLTLEGDLRVALARDDLLVHYQPVIDVSSGQPRGFEALVRWAHPTQGLISPARFIPVAEESGLIIPLGAWVLREACRQAQRWQADRTLTMSVNVSALQFEQPDFVPTVQAALTATGLDPRLLILELTESAVLRDPEAAVAQLRALRALGVRVALDDFGTGHSSLGLLKTLPVDLLKIDRSFVQGDGAEVMVGVIVTLAQAFGLEVIAEGVETPAQFTLIQGLRCDGVQGYLFARPAPAGEMSAFLATRP
ncbi:EAL domain-containing protein [Deinococcus ficus]|uniref:EAL domain-containing protein n=1 Tax=Deinococcus ficus TaxID=317577 RepID=UPI0003B5C2E9|nr:EAL domain-containing protein [Deinococcus ficus]